MDLLDRMLGHDQAATAEAIAICAGLDDALLDRPFDVGHRTLRDTLDHMIFNVEAWTAMMSGAGIPDRERGRRIADLAGRHEASQDAFAALARGIRAAGRFNERFVDRHGVAHPFGGAIVHVVLHDAQHRAELMHILERLGVPDLPDGDPLAWEYDQAHGRG